MNKYIPLLLLLVLVGCKKQLDVGNPNQPTIPQDVNNQSGLIAFAQGVVYIDGFQSANAYNWLGSSYFSLNYGYAELDADMVASDDANESVNTINVPAYVILDDGTHVPANPNATQGTTLRVTNTRSSTKAGYNPFYYEWANMYIMNGDCNTVLSLIPTIKFTGDTAAVANTIRTWCYFWKGYAYSVIGSQYYAGLVVNTSGSTNGNYMIRDSIIAESNYWFNQALATLALIPSGSADYSSVVGSLIPGFCQVGNGGVLTPTMWTHNINTMLARNILVNKLAPFVNGNLNASIQGASVGTMGTTDWQQVLSLATNGIQNGDYVFTGRSVEENGFFSASSGTASLITAGPNSNTVFKPSMRFTQNFNAGDLRFSQNFYDSVGTYYSDYFSTPYSLSNVPNTISSVYNYGDQTVGNYELFIAGSYEENELMLAESNIRLGNVNAGLLEIDAVRNYQGAGVAAVGGTGLSAPLAYQELVKERRVALFDRGLSFWDTRRWGWTYDISKGGGSYGNMMIYTPSSGSPTTETNVTFDYDFMDYWDVPADELELNPPTGGTGTVTKNPNF